MFKLVLEKAEESEIKLPTSTWLSKMQGSSRKYLLLLYWLFQSFWLCESPQTVENSERWEYQTTWPASWETYMQIRKQQLTGYGTTEWFQTLKGVHQVCILSLCSFNLFEEYIMRNAGLDETQVGIKIDRRNINNFRYADDTTLMAESEEELKRLLMKLKEES